MPASEQDLASLPIVVGEGPLESAPPLVWLRNVAGESRIAFRSNSLAGMIAATTAGLGVSCLPVLAAGRQPDLLRCATLPVFRSPVWLCIHEGRKEDHLIRTVMDFLAQEIRRQGLFPD